MNNTIKELTDFLAEAPMCFIATVSNNEPRVRPFLYKFEQDGKLWFATAKFKDVFKQLQANPAVEICTVKQDKTWLRINGKVTLEDNRAVKERILAEVPRLKDIFGTADNPDFTTFYIGHGTYTIDDFSDNPPRGGSF